MRDDTLENAEEIQVKLKPFLGVPPTTYLPILYSVAIVGIFFLLFILPGLVRAGTFLTVRSSPPHAAVAIDGVIRGTSGEKIFVRAGTRSVTVSKPGFTAFEDEIVVGRRLVGSLIFPRRRTFNVELVAVSTEHLIEAAALNYSRWALVGEASGQYQFPPVARELGVDLAASGSSGLYGTFSEIALAHMDSEAQLNDLLAGALLGAAGGVAPGPFAIASVVQDLAAVAENAPGLPAQLAEFLSGRRRQILSESDWAAVGAERLAELQSTRRIGAAEAKATSRSYGGLVFLQAPAGAGLVGGTDRAERGGDIAYSVDLGAFLISQTEVTVGAYSRFLADVPAWSPDNRETLIGKGLVDGDYLRDWDGGMPTATLPVRNVSAYAADAFAAWFSGLIPGTGLTARLPSEAEWDYLAALDEPETGVFATVITAGPSVVGESVRGKLGLFGLAGNLWEWTSDPFATYARYHTGTSLPSSPGGSVHRVVRGGGWATLENDFIIDDRGSMPPDWCSGAVGFRIVLSEK